MDHCSANLFQQHLASQQGLNKSVQKLTITAVIASQKQIKLKHVSQLMMESQNFKRKQGIMTRITLAQASLGQPR